MDNYSITFPWADWIINGQLTSDYYNTHVLGDLGLPVKNYLGNIKKALYANFSVKNLALPTEISATVTTTKNGQTASTASLSPLLNEGAFLLAGFSAADYDNDVRSENHI